MESLNLSNTIRFASDEYFEYECRPCKNDGEHKEANFYCPDCEFYLCCLCEVLHRRFSSSRKHKVVSCNQLLSKQDATYSSSQGNLLCACGLNRVQDYCKTHEDVFCSDCIKLSHRNCKYLTIENDCKTFGKENANGTLSRANELEQSLEKIKSSGSKGMQTLVTHTDSCRKSITAFTQEIESQLDRLELKYLQEVEERVISQQNGIKQQIDVCTAGLRKLDLYQRCFQTFTGTSDRRKIFVWNLRLPKILKELRSTIIELGKESFEPYISFNASSRLLNMEANRLGIVVSQHHSESRKTVTDMTVKSVSAVTVKLASDKSYPNITASVFAANGELILCDYNNNSLKALDCTFAVKYELGLPGKPWDIATVGYRAAVVTIPKEKKLQFVQTLPSLRLERVTQLDTAVWGIESYKNDLYISCHNCPGDAEIRVYDCDGQLKKVLVGSRNGKSMLSSPNHITISTKGDVWVADQNLKKVICIQTDGSFVDLVSNKSLQKPSGMWLDGQNSLLICDSRANNLQMYDEHGNKLQTLLTASDGLTSPQTINYSHIENTVVVGGASGVLFLLKMGDFQQTFDWEYFQV